MSNIKVVLTHEDAPELNKAMTRVIDGNLLKANSPEGRKQEARALYLKMMGIKSTNHPIDADETDEPAFVAPPVPVSDAARLERAKEERAMTGMAKALADGIAEGVAKALKAYGISDKPKSNAPVVAETEVTPVVTETASSEPSTGTMRKSARKTL